MEALEVLDRFLRETCPLICVFRFASRALTRTVTVASVVTSFSSFASRFFVWSMNIIFRKLKFNVHFDTRLVGVPDISKVQSLIEKFDEDKDGKLTFGEFIKSVKRTLQFSLNSIQIFRLIAEMEDAMAPNEEIDMIRRAFETNDLDQDGYLTKEELKIFVQKMGKHKSVSFKSCH